MEGPFLFTIICIDILFMCNSYCNDSVTGAGKQELMDNTQSKTKLIIYEILKNTKYEISQLVWVVHHPLLSISYQLHSLGHRPIWIGLFYLGYFSTSVHIY